MDRFSLFIILIFSFNVARAERLAESSDAANSSRPSGGPALVYEASKKKNRVQMVKINGCSQRSTFQTHYGKPSSKGPRCDKALAMNKALADAINTYLPECINRSANAVFGYGKLTTELGASGNHIYHHGCVGDARHQKTGSWHNEGLAIDLTGLKVGGMTLKYEDATKNKGAKVDRFFGHLRKCWSDKVKAHHSSCRKTGKKGRAESGSIGYEDKKHQHHLHLSLPCATYSNGRATFKAEWWFWQSFFPEALADELSEDDEGDEPVVTLQKLSAGSGEITLKIEDFQGEPVGNDHMISVGQKCKSGVELKVFPEAIEACALDEAKIVEGKLSLRYRIARLDEEGILKCSDRMTQRFTLPCPGAKK